MTETDTQHSSIVYNEKPEVKSNLCQGIKFNIYREINAYVYTNQTAQ